MKKWTLAVLLFSLAINISVLGTLFYLWKMKKMPPPEPPFPMHEGPGGPQGAEMKFPPEESNFLRDARKEHFSKIEPLFAQINVEREKLFQELLGDEPDMDSIKVSVEAIEHIKAKIEFLTVTHFLGLKEKMPDDFWKPVIENFLFRERAFKKGPRDFGHKKSMNKREQGE